MAGEERRWPGSRTDMDSSHARHRNRAFPRVSAHFAEKQKPWKGKKKKNWLQNPESWLHSEDTVLLYRCTQELTRGGQRHSSAVKRRKKKKTFILQFFRGLNPQTQKRRCNSRRLSAQFILWFCLSSANPQRAFVLNGWGLLIPEDKPPTHLGKLWEKDALAGVLDRGLFTRDSPWFLQWCFLWVTPCMDTWWRLWCGGAWARRTGDRACVGHCSLRSDRVPSWSGSVHAVVLLWFAFSVFCLYFAPQFELIKGRPLILMHFQSKTCNRLVDEALEVVIFRGPFDHFTSRL